MIVKIQNFGNDVAITEPLSDSVDCVVIQTVSNGIKTDWHIDDAGSFTINYRIDEEPTSMKLLPILTRGATSQLTYIDEITASLVIVSESTAVSRQVDIAFVQSSDTLDTVQVFSIIDHNTGEDCVTYYSGTSNVNILKTPWYDNGSQWINVQPVTNFAYQTTHELISFNGLEPDEETVFGTLVAMNTSEESILDHTKVYLRIENNTDVIYFRIDKSSEALEPTRLTNIKNAIGNQWVRLVQNIAFLPTDNIELLYEVYSLTESTLVKQFLTGNGIIYYDISEWALQIIDFTATEAYVHDNYSKLLYANNLQYVGLHQFGSDFIGKSFARSIYDELALLQSTTELTAVMTWLRVIWDDTFVLCDKIGAREAYMSHVGINILMRLSTRLLNHMLKYLRYIEYVTNNGLATYNLSYTDLLKSIQSLESIILLKSDFQSSAISVNNAIVFFASIELLMKNTQILGISDWLL